MVRRWKRQALELEVIDLRRQLIEQEKRILALESKEEQRKDIREEKSKDEVVTPTKVLNDWLKAR